MNPHALLTLCTPQQDIVSLPGSCLAGSEQQAKLLCSCIQCGSWALVFYILSVQYTGPLTLDYLIPAFLTSKRQCDFYIDIRQGSEHYRFLKLNLVLYSYLFAIMCKCCACVFVCA